MEAIRQIVKIPKSHEVMIKIPFHIAEDELMEVILLVKGRKQSHKSKMEQMKHAAKDPMFLADMEAVNRDFEFADAEGWEYPMTEFKWDKRGTDHICLLMK